MPLDRVVPFGSMFALRAGLQESQYFHEWSFCCDNDCTGCIAIAQVESAVPCCAPMFLGYYALLCIDRAVLYCALVVAGCFVPICIDRAMPYQAAFLLQAILHLCMAYARSCDFGVLRNLKLILDNSHDV